MNYFYLFHHYLHSNAMFYMCFDRKSNKSLNSRCAIFRSDYEISKIFKYGLITRKISNYFINLRVEYSYLTFIECIVEKENHEKKKFSIHLY